MINYLLQLPPIWALLIISTALSLLTNIAYKLLTNQKLMKEIKDKMKEHQKNMKNNKEPEKMMHANKELMELNAKYMMHSLKPSLITMLPLLIIIGWLSAHYTYMPIIPGQEFTTSITFTEGTTGMVTLQAQEGIETIGEKTKEISNRTAEFTLKGKEGEYLLRFEHNETEYTKRVLITKQQEYEKPITIMTGNAVKEIKINNEASKPLTVPIVGWKFGWLGTYIILSLISNLAIRKAMRLH